MNARISEIRSYPVKGLSGSTLSHTKLEPGQVIPGDRQFALGRPGFKFDTTNPVWVPKTNFLTLVKDEKLAKIDAKYDDEKNLLTLRQEGDVVFDFMLATPEGRSSLEGFFADFLTNEVDGPPTLLEADDHSFSDLDARVVSLINLDSVADVAATIGTDLDARRFRANVYFEGLPAWREFDWLGQHIRMGDAVLEVVKRTQRCAAINVNPDTATRDINLPRALQKRWGHMDLGVYARVISPGEIWPGDTLSKLN
ncbi:MAG: MOSC domain-containing protein [Alphaproteobacteria bacterium]|nr:MOSC domain-containing protein [Alphaproteobacteria bacterium]HCP01879.1 MOSC domain-containing protein [Rhodospirillaceae bacterium]